MESLDEESSIHIGNKKLFGNMSSGLNELPLKLVNCDVSFVATISLPGWPVHWAVDVYSKPNLIASLNHIVKINEWKAQFLAMAPIMIWYWKYIFIYLADNGICIQVKIMVTLWWSHSIQRSKSELGKSYNVLSAIKQHPHQQKSFIFTALVVTYGYV